MEKKAEKREYRTLSPRGKVQNGVPIKTGETFLTATGNLTTPYPKKTSARAASEWLIKNATAEAERLGNNLAKRMFSNERPLKDGELPQASLEAMTACLFDPEFPK